MDAEHAPGPGRRRFLRAGIVGGLAVIAGAGAGVGLELSSREPAARPAPPPAPPPILLAAAQAERVLIADLDATTGGSAAVRDVIRQTRADHAAHLRVIEELIASTGARVGSASGSARSAATGSASASAARGTPRTVAQLRRAEQAASSAAAARAAQLHQGAAALLASVAACEATHAELFAPRSS